MKKVLQFVLLTLSVLTTLGSCSDETFIESKPGDAEGEIETAFSIKLMDNSQVKLRSLGTNEENTVERIDVLAFRRHPSDPDKIIFDYYTEGYAVSDNGFSAKVYIRNYEQLFVVAANVPANMIKELFDESWAGVEKDEILSRIIYYFPQNNGWKKDSYAKLPMSGESEWTTIGIESKKIQNTVTLLRMVAKVNVMIDDQKIETLGNKFKLDVVYLYKPNTCGKVMPAAENMEGIKVIAPTVPDSAGQVHSIRFENDGESPSIKDVAICGGIYTFEVENSKNYNNPLSATSLVIGGRYGEGNMTDTTYYRLDFFNTDKNGFVDILRNHQYDVRILDVNGSGHATPDEAYNTRQSDVTINVTSWEMVDSETHIVFMGQHYLAVSKDEFKFSRMAYDREYENNVFYIKTNYPDGWSIDSIYDPYTHQKINWLHIVIVPSPIPRNIGEHKVLLHLDPNETSAEREAVFDIRAGALKFSVDVIQTLVEPVTIDLFRDEYNLYNTDTISPDTTVIFPSLPNNTPSSGLRSFHLRWRPKRSVMVRYMKPADGWTIFQPAESGYMTQLVDNTESTRNFAVYTFSKTWNASESLQAVVTEENPFPEKRSWAEYSVTNGIETINKQYLFRLVWYNVKIIDKKTMYGFGITHTFTVRSNNTWWIDNIIDNDNIITNKAELRNMQNYHTGGHGYLSNYTVSFKLIEYDSNKIYKEASIIVATDDGFETGDFRRDTLRFRIN
ncbi:MAG: hypothetical protein LBH32_06370 [Dysgonamonadaceae bacterium]|jgi:hypothetical protein|nr:hypothetical protein [Dysgonamonadaceae bacterium]